MALVTNVSDLATRVGTEIKNARAEHRAEIGQLPALKTTDKSSVVAAINELQVASQAKTDINDAATSGTSTWSSQKIDQQIKAAKPNWSTIEGKPATFPPTIGTTATTAKAGNWAPSWAEVTGKPTLASVATSGKADDLTGTLPTSVLPPLAVNEVFTAANQTAMLALKAERGDMAIRTDNGRTYVLSSDKPGTLADWKEITAAGSVTSVNGKTGAVTIGKADVGLGSVDNTSDKNKPISTATAAELAKKAVIGTTAGTAVDNKAIGDPETNFVAIFEAALA